MSMLAVRPVSAQEHPNFSGEWVKVEPVSETEASLVVLQDARTINIEQKSSPGPRSATYDVGTFGGVMDAVIDGCGGGSLEWMWKEATLVVMRQQTICSGGETKQSKHDEVWSLDTDGRLIIVITDEETGTAPITMRFLYRKRR
jgi:hypothetical protein